MFPELNNLLDIPTDEFPAGKNIAILEGDTDGSFIIHHFISLAVKTRKKLCLITTVQSVNHYNNVANKLGVNLANERSSGNLVIIELLKDLGQQIIPLTDSTNADQISSEGVLKGLYAQVTKIITDFGTSDVFVVVDDISPLLSIGLSLASVRLWVQYMSALVRHQPRSCVVQLMHCGYDIRVTGVAGDEEVEQVARQLCHAAHGVVMVTGLPTGYCRDVHGQVEVTWHDGRAVGRVPGRRMQYKVHDKSVKFFPLGMSAAAIGL